jgi:alpha-tubulin suppressor-like RCC1 family protein
MLYEIKNYEIAHGCTVHSWSISKIIGDGNTVTDIQSGEDHVMLLASDGKVYTRGSDSKSLSAIKSKQSS